MESGYLLGSIHVDDALMCTLGRVSVARMATVKPHGWVHASLEGVRIRTPFPKWSELDNQIMESRSFTLNATINVRTTET